MKKLYEIGDCSHCPHSTFRFEGLRCTLADRWMDDRYYPEIPKWCPLPDANIPEFYRFTDADGILGGL